MGLCGCYPACACQLEAGNDLVTITGTGDSTDPFVISGVETPFSLTNDDGGLDVTPDGPYGHEPRANLRISDSPTIALVVTPEGGLSADLIVAPGEGGGVPTGAFFPWLTNVAPSGYLMLTGPNMAGYVDYGDYPALFAVVEHTMSGGVDPMDGTFYVGLPDDSALITQGTLGGIGTLGGVMDVTLGATQIPNHGHGVLDPGHGHAGSTVTIVSDGAHEHEAGTGGNAFFVTVNDIAGEAQREITEATVSPGNTFSIPTNTGTGASDFEQGTRGFTSNDGGHVHAGSSVAIADATTGVSVIDMTGGGASHTNMSPYFVTNYIIKT